MRILIRAIHFRVFFEDYELFKSFERIILIPPNRRDSLRFFDDRDSANSLGFARAGRCFPDDVRRCIGCSGSSPLGVLHEPSYIPVITVISVAAARPRTRWRRSVDNEVGRGHGERGFSLVWCRLIRPSRNGHRTAEGGNNYERDPSEMHLAACNNYN